MGLDVETGLALIQKAKEQDLDDRLRLQWTVQLPFMSEQDFVSYEDYKARCTGANIDRRSTAALLHEIDEAEREIEEGGH